MKLCPGLLMHCMDPMLIYVLPRAILLAPTCTSATSTPGTSTLPAGMLLLSVGEPQRAPLVAAGAIPACTHAALSGSPAAKEAAARCLTNLATSEPHRAAIISEGGGTVLATLLRAGTPGARFAAAKALHNLSKSKAGRRFLLEAGAVEALVIAAEAETRCFEAAVFALGHLCKSRQALALLVRAGGPAVLAKASAAQEVGLRVHKVAAKLLSHAKAYGGVHSVVPRAGPGNMAAACMQ
jgi:hypothetical protein